MKPIEDIKRAKKENDSQIDLRAVFEAALEAEAEMTRVAEVEMAAEIGFEQDRVVPDFQVPETKMEIVLEEWEVMDPEQEETRRRELRRQLRRWGGMRRRDQIKEEALGGGKNLILGVREDLRRVKRMGERMKEAVVKSLPEWEVEMGGERLMKKEKEEKFQKRIDFQVPHWEKVKKSWLHQPGLALGMSVMLILGLGISGMMMGGRVLERVKMEAKALSEVAENLQENPSLGGMDEAVAEFLSRLQVIKTNLREIGMLPNWFPNHSFFQTGDRLLQLADQLAVAAEKGNEMLQILSQMNLKEVMDEEGEGLGLQRMKGMFEEVVEAVSKAREISEEVETWMIPGSEGEKIKELKERLPEIEEILREGEKWLVPLLRMMGSERQMRWLLVLQNSGELRATGGFFGSLGILTLNDGRGELEMKDVYDFDGQLQRVIPAPPGISEVSDRLFLRDANYWPDFPTSAQMMADLFEESGGPTVDGVVAVTDTILGDFLEVTGEVELTELGLVFDQKWWWWQLVKVIEAKETGKTTPKQVLFALVEEIKAKLAEKGEWKQMAEVLLKALMDKKVQVWVRDDEEASMLLGELGVTGKLPVPQEGEDFIHISRTNVGGNKSDKMMKEKIMSATEIADDGTVTDTLTMRRWHGWTEEWETEVRRKFGLFAQYEWLEPVVHILGKGENRTWWRIFVPRGSELLRVSGIKMEEVKMEEDGGWNVISFSTQTAPEETDEWSLQWELPWKVERSEKGWVWKWGREKQSGVQNSEWLRNLEVGESWCMEQDSGLACEREREGTGEDERLLISGR